MYLLTAERWWIMRLDKYLKVSRLVKRRTVANELCDAGRVLVNNKVARASYEVKENDTIELRIAEKVKKVKVTQVLTYALKEDAQNIYVDL